MDGNSVDTAPKSEFRAYLPNLQEGMLATLPKHDANSWKDEFFKNPFSRQLEKLWTELRNQPFKGITSDGNIVPDLYRYEDHGVNMQPIVEAAEHVFHLCNPEQMQALKQALNSRTWRYWANPEIYMDPLGVRLEEISREHSDAILRVIECSLSPAGYQKVLAAMRTNRFLGELVNGVGVLNERSYNFQIFGTPSTTAAWGWSIFGHHMCMNVYLDRGYIAVAPVFIGAEPNEIDEGPYRGTVMMRAEEAAGLCLMQSLPPDLQKKAQVYASMQGDKMPPGRWNLADQRHMCGCAQDNRVVPYEGVNVGEMGPEQVELVCSVLGAFLEYLPDGALRARMAQIRRHLNETYFCWIGGFGDRDPFYYRIQSPVVVVEFDHHSAVFLGNEEPKRFHIRTIARMPNAGDYGNAVRRPEDRLEQDRLNFFAAHGLTDSLLEISMSIRQKQLRT